MIEPKDSIEQAIIHLELIITNIMPYSWQWRSGYITSLRRAIDALKKMEKLK